MRIDSVRNFRIHPAAGVQPALGREPHQDGAILPLTVRGASTH